MKRSLLAAAVTAAALFAAFAIAQSADDGQWTMPARNHAGHRFSALDQITPANAAQLKLAFSFSTGGAKGHEAAPLVVDNTMYIVGPYPNTVFALDLTKPGAS